MSEDIDAIDRVIANLALKESRVRRKAYEWMGSVLNEDRDPVISAENLAAVGYYLLMTLDHPEELDNIKLTVLPYVCEDEDDVDG